MRRNYTKEQDNFIINGINDYCTVYDLTDAFNAKFPEHYTDHRNLRKRMKLLGVKKGTHNIRPEKRHSVNAIGTVIKSKGHYARVKTENGYVSATKYFKQKYFPNQDGMLIHLNGDYADYSEENLMLVSKTIYSSLHSRKWIFPDAELTKTAVLTAQLLEFFPEYRHNENQFLKLYKTEARND